MSRWSEEDKEPFAAMNADPEVMEHFPALLTREQSDALVGRSERHFDEHGYSCGRSNCGAAPSRPPGVPPATPSRRPASTSSSP